MTSLLQEPEGNAVLTGSCVRYESPDVSHGQDIRLSLDNIREIRPPTRSAWKWLVRASEDPPWIRPAIEAFNELLALPENWDSYGARPVDPRHIQDALYILSRIMRDGTPRPAIGPTNRGGVVMEWHQGGVDLEIETIRSGRCRVSFEDAEHDEEWEQDVFDDDDALMSVVDRLSRQE